MSHSLILVFLSLVIGNLGWTGNEAFLPLVIIFPAVWVFSRRRWIGAVCAGVYHLSASKGLVLGTATYFDSTLLNGLIIWLGAGLVQILPYVFLWNSERHSRVVRIPLLLLVLAVPPIGIVGWANPVTAAGVIFPGFGWVGLGLTIGLIMMIARWPVISAVPIVLSFVLMTNNYLPEPQNPQGWKGFNTHFEFDSGTRDFYADFHRQLDMIEMAKRSTANVVVFAESMGGRWNRLTESVWRDYYPDLDKVILVGAEVQLLSGKYLNGIVAISGEGSEVLYRQRMPVPVSMWKPWAKDGALAHWFLNPVVEIEGLRVAPLICYEQFLVWPVLQSIFYKPDVILAVGNGWWSEGTNIVRVQEMIVGSWARLFKANIALSQNYL